MAVRRRRPTVRRFGRGNDPAGLGRRRFAVDLTLDARLFRRIPILSIEAAIDVSEPAGGRTSPPGVGAGFERPPLTSRPPLAPARVSGPNGAPRHRRSDVEALLEEARQHLDSSPEPPPD